MQRLLTSMMAMGLVFGVLGCHTAGSCDCDLCDNTCTYDPLPASSCCSDGTPGLIHGTGSAYQSAMPMVVGEPLKVVPTDGNVKEHVSSPNVKDGDN